MEMKNKTPLLKQADVNFSAPIVGGAVSAVSGLVRLKPTPPPDRSGMLTDGRNKAKNMVYIPFSVLCLSVGFAIGTTSLPRRVGKAKWFGGSPAGRALRSRSGSGMSAGRVK